MSSGFFYDVAQFVQAVQTWNSRLPEIKPSPGLLEACSQYARECLHEAVSPSELLTVKRRSRLVNLEQFYRYLTEKTQPGGSPSERLELEDLKLHLAKRDLVSYVGSSLSYVGHLCRSENHVRFAKQLSNGTTVISFNWDILLEEALASQRAWDWETGYGIRFNDVVHKGDGASWGYASKEGAVLVLKPHGSINWFRDSSDTASHAIDLVVPEGDPYLRGGNPQQTMLQDYEEIKGKFERVCISPPGSGRFIHPEIIRLMKERLEQAHQIVAIGFSFNERDSHVLAELKEYTYQKDLEVTLVNPHADELEQVYEEAFANRRITKLRQTFSRHLDSIETTRKEIG